MRHSKLTPEVNAGSMADIAFLLLMFFLVTSAIPNDKGFNRKLSSVCPPNTDCTKEIANRNMLRITINGNDEIMANNQVIALEELKDIIKNFVDNNGNNTCEYCHGEQSANASDHPTKAVISLENSQQTSYSQFIGVQDEISKAYYELRNTYSNEVLKKPSHKLSLEEINLLKAAYPFNLSEAQTK